MVDILAFGVHPDDIELGAGGTLIKHVKKGFKVGLVDLTQGELGTRGTAETRKVESENAAHIIGADFRVNLNMEDAFVSTNKDNIIKIVQLVRLYKPKIVICNAIKDRHPDHAEASKLVVKSCFNAGLSKLITQYNSVDQKAHRPDSIYHYIQDQWIDPSLVVDVSDVYDEKIKAVMAYKTQFYNPKSTEPSTPISSKEFLDSLNAKAQLWGRSIKTKYGEGFTLENPVGINSLFDIF